MGTQYHRPIERVQLPPQWALFPAFLRDAGYYTANNHKTDYNTTGHGGTWDDSSPQAHWRHRDDPDTPFFFMQTFTTTHEGRLHFDRDTFENEPTQADPNAIEVFPYLPDTDLMRYTHAYFLDLHRRMDRQVGRLIEQLEEDGLLESTIIFYFGDHGGTLPRSKGYIYEGGVHVPLIVYVPERFAHLVPHEPGSRAEEFVSFVDFGPTVLRLAGVDVPDYMDGRPFLGPGVEPADLADRDESFSYADRFDEKYDLVRALRKGRYKYIRNYQPFYPDALQNNYRYRMLAYQQWRSLYHEGELNATQRRHFEARPAEALYDIRNDPHEVNNLADDPAYAAVLAEMRDRLRERVTSLPDTSFLPESVGAAEAVTRADTFAAEHADRIGRLVDVADLALRPFEEAREPLEAALASEDRWQRYWALIVCSSFAEQATLLAPAARARLEDEQEEPLVRVRAAEFLGIIREADPVPVLEHVLGTEPSPAVTLLTLNTLTFLRDHHRYAVEVTPDDVRAAHPEIDRRLEYLAQQRPDWLEE